MERPLKLRAQFDPSVCMGLHAIGPHAGIHDSAPMGCQLCLRQLERIRSHVIAGLNDYLRSQGWLVRDIERWMGMSDTTLLKHSRMWESPTAWRRLEIGRFGDCRFHGSWYPGDESLIGTGMVCSSGVSIP
jgi:hypothetical protein